MLDKRHGIVRFLGAHLLHPWAEARDGEDDDIAHLLGGLDAGESLPRDVLPIHLVIRRVVQITEHGVGPDGRAGEFHDGLIELLFFQDPKLLHSKGVFGDGGDDVAENRMAGFGLNGPLAELNPARIPVTPVHSVGVGFNANNETDRGARDLGGKPVRRGLQCRGVNIRVDASTCEQDEVAKEVRLQHR